MKISGVSAPEKARLNLGYLRLTDSAPLITALERGFFESAGLDVALHQEVSWANVRDKLAAGALDAAQMLAPLPAMTTLGVSGLRVPMLSGITLSLNGNAITLASALLEDMGAGGARAGAPPAAANARRLAGYLSSRKRPITLGIVHSFSSHAIQLRAWLQAGGIEPDRQIRTLVVPPSQMPDSLASGVIDGYCAGEPWNTIAVQQGLGQIVAFGNQIWENAPEKVLAVTERWHQRHPAAHQRLLAALIAACDWLSKPANRLITAQAIGAPEFLDMPESRLAPSLTGRLVCVPGEEPVAVEDFHVFSTGNAGLPCRRTASFMIERSAELLGRPLTAEKTAALVQQTTRPDLFRQAAHALGQHTDDDAPTTRTNTRTSTAFALN